MVPLGIQKMGALLTDKDPIPEIEEPDEDEELDPQGWIGLTFDPERNDFVEDECKDIPNSDVPKTPYHVRTWM